MQLKSSPCFELAEAAQSNKGIDYEAIARSIGETAALTIHHASRIPHSLTPRPPKLRLPFLGLGQQQHKPTQGSAATKLNNQLASCQAPTHLAPNSTTYRTKEEKETFIDTTTNTPTDITTTSRLQDMAVRIGGMLQPQGGSSNDDTAIERTINIATSLPFLTMGADMMRRRKTSEGKLHGASLFAVGISATLYHASWGAARDLFRKIDYWTISVSAMQMVKAMYPQQKWVKRAADASLAVIPFRPFWISTAGTTIMQAEFIRQARKHDAVKSDLQKHVAAATFGAAAFALEDPLREKGIGFVHSAWHILALWGVSTLGCLVDHKERLHVDTIDRINTKTRKRDSGSMLKNSVVHDSVSSLVGL